MPYKRPNDKKAYMQKYESEHKEKRRAYQRQWRSDNPEKVKVYQEAYWRKKLGCTVER